jgi:hypothetical protein
VIGLVGVEAEADLVIGDEAGEEAPALAEGGVYGVGVGGEGSGQGDAGEQMVAGEVERGGRRSARSAGWVRAAQGRAGRWG